MENLKKITMKSGKSVESADSKQIREVSSN